jgi:hypothetical protein
VISISYEDGRSGHVPDCRTVMFDSMPFTRGFGAPSDLSARTMTLLPWRVRVAGISFEHAWFLLLALTRHDEVDISRCTVCGGVRLRDLLAKHKVGCGACGPVAAAPCQRPQ